MLWLFACTTAEPELAPEPMPVEPSYLALLDQEPQAALQGCTKLEDERERGDCTLFAVIALGKLKQDALGACLDLASGWRALCVLEYSDAARLTGAAAEEACLLAGDLKERCIAHVISREVSNRWLETGWGGEAGLLAWTEARLVEVDYASFLSARESLAIELVAGLVSEDRIRQGTRYGESLCGTLPDEACNEVIRLALKRQKVPYDACVHKEPALAQDDYDMPSWHEGLDDRMMEAWELYCQDAPAEEDTRLAWMKAPQQQPDQDRWLAWLKAPPGGGGAKDKDSDSPLLGIQQFQIFQDLLDEGLTGDDPLGWLELGKATVNVFGNSPGQKGGDEEPDLVSLFGDLVGSMVMVSGSISGIEEGPLDLDLLVANAEMPGGSAYVGKILLDGPGVFSFEAPGNLGLLSIQAFHDLTGDGPSRDDPFAFTDLQVGGQDIQGVDLVLEIGGRAVLTAQKDQGGGSSPDDSPGPFVDHDGEWTLVGGTLTGAGEGLVDADLRVLDTKAKGGNRQLGKLKLDHSDGTWEMQVPRGMGMLVLEVFQDLDGDGPSNDEPYATATIDVGSQQRIQLDLALLVSARGEPSPGNPATTKRADGAIFPDLGSDPVTLSGTISVGPGVSVEAAQVALDVFSQGGTSEAGRNYLGKLMVGPGAFRIKAPRGVGKLELEAYVDLGGDGPSPGDPFGSCTANPVEVADRDVDGLSIVLEVSDDSP